jgi:hypothetical protein
METIAIAHYRSKSSKGFFGTYSKWNELARKDGVRFQDVVYDPDADNGKEAYKKADWLVRNSGALIIREEVSFLNDEIFRQIVLERLKQGLKVLVIAPPKPSAQVPDYSLEPFINYFGIERTDIGVFSDTPFEKTDKISPRLFEVNRAEHPYAFRDMQLFADVDRVIIDSANILKLHGAAQSLLVAPTEKTAVVDISKDLFVDWSSPDLPVLAGNYHLESGGALIVLFGSLLHDPYTGYRGHNFDGIDNNLQFARNLITYLTGRGKSTRDYELEAYGLLRRIERNLVDVVRYGLSDKEKQWWEYCVPDKIKDKCKGRCKREGEKLPPEAYLELIDLIKLIQTNWDSFSEGLKTVGYEGGKSKLQSWLGVDRLLEIRKLSAHALKGYVACTSITHDDIQNLKLTDKKVIELYNKLVGII